LDDVSSRRHPVRRPYDNPSHQEATMQYMLFIYGDESQEADVSEEEAAAVYAEYDKFGHEMGEERGVLRGGARLRPSSDSTTVRVSGGETLTSDGPFAETKEQIGGYFLVDCKDLDEAIEIAAKIPGASLGTIEVRPLWEM
jgi:hypothetical protein